MEETVRGPKRSHYFGMDEVYTRISYYTGCDEYVVIFIINLITNLQNA